MKTNKSSTINPTTHQNAVLNWFNQHGRKDLPWQQHKTPYRVWVSEIMLQQTQVSTVTPYFIRFMENFPDIDSLAQALEDEVLHLWTGLGYYSRARNLHKTAKVIVAEYNGKFPATLEELEMLPGIGRSTAGAILALGFEKQATILDGNVKRVLVRLQGITQWSGEKDTAQQLWDLAEKLTPAFRIADYTQAMMDLGATLCVRGKKPRCEVCPLIKMCRAKALGIEKTLPQTKPSKKIPIRKATLLILKNKHSVLLEKRPPTGIWGSLWSLPELSGHLSMEEIKTQQRFPLKIKKLKMGNIFRHTFSHFHLDILPVVIDVDLSRTKIMEGDLQIWYNLLEPINIGLPAPIKSLLSNPL